MKKSYLPLAVALFLLPQILISQDSMELTHPLDVQEEVDTSNMDDSTPATLKFFELVEDEDNNFKVVASFIAQESFELKLFNAQGLNIYQESFQTDELNLAMGFSNLPDGNYFISLTTKDGEVIKPFK